MENYSYNYPDSGNSSPRSREIDFENPPPWDEQSPNPPNYKAKFMCSYGGKIQPRPHDNQLSYIGGETKIFSVDRNTKFSSMISKLSALCGGESEVSFKYQLPGEDLDALISVTNDDDLEHMMLEYDRLYRASAKPARMRLFIFPVTEANTSFSSDGGKFDRERFVEALNSVPVPVPGHNNSGPAPNNVDFLFGLEKGIVAPQPVKIHSPAPEPVTPPPLHRIPEAVESEMQLQRQMQEFQRLQIQDQEQRRRKSEEINRVPYSTGEYYGQKMPERGQAMSVPSSVQQSVPVQQGYWVEKQIPAAGYPTGSAPVQSHPSEHPVYMIQAPPPGAVYHAHSPIPAPAPAAQPPQMVRSVSGQVSQPGQVGQGYYTNVQRMPADMYREHAMYNMAAAQTHPAPISAVQQQMVRPGGGEGYSQQPQVSAGYDRQVYYTAPAGGGVMLQPHYQGVGVAVSGEMRAASTDGKVVTNSQGSV